MKYFLFFLIFPSFLYASTPEEDANASIGIAQARIVIGMQRPQLPDRPPQAVGPEEVAHAETQGFESDTRAMTEEDSRNSEESTAVEETGAQVENAKAETPIAEDKIVDLKPSESVPPTPISGEIPASDPIVSDATWHPVKPMKIEYSSNEPQSESLPAQLVISVTDHCPPCDRQKKEVIRKLKPLNWKIGSDSDDHIVFEEYPRGDDRDYPRSRLFQNGVMIKEFVGYHSSEVLSNELRAAWDSAPPVSRSFAASGSAGTIHAVPQIRKTFEFIRCYVGEGSTTFTWDRNGERALNLLALSDLTAKDIFGTEGRFQIESPEATGFPTKEFAFTYRIRGEDVLVDAEQVLLKGYASKLSIAKGYRSGVGAVPVGLFGLDDILLADSIFNVIKDILSILNPQADVVLGETIQCNAALKNNVLTVNFDKGPQIKLVCLFTFKLTVKTVEIILDGGSDGLNSNHVRILFSGSRWVRERTFNLE